MKNKLLFLLLSSTLITSIAEAKSDSVETSIVVVDIQNVVKESTAAKNIREQIEKKRNDYQSEINKRESELNKKHQALNKEQSVLSKEAFEHKLQEFDNKVAEVQKDVQSKRAKLDESYMSAIEKIQVTVDEIIANLAQERGFILALPTSQILFAKNSLDISQEVLTRLNNKLPKVDVVVPK
jgi:Skp family chaperone for outer membrane proteins